MDDPIDWSLDSTSISRHVRLNYQTATAAATLLTASLPPATLPTHPVRRQRMGQEDGQAGRPWLADALDPLENLRALADVQAFGRRAAEDLADRILAWGNGQNGRGARSADDSDGSPGPGLAEVLDQLRGDAALAGEVSGRLVEHAILLLGLLLERLPAAPRPDAAEPSVAPAPVRAGAETSAVFWVHNTSGAVVPAVRAHCAAPRSHLGRKLGAGAVVFDPQVLDPLPARSSCGIEVRVRVPPSAAPGTYMSVVMATNVPDLYLPLRVTVTEPGPSE
jgi:hypothetical protein